MANNGRMPADLVRSEPRIGGSGLVVFGGQLYNMADYNPALQGQQAMSRYEEMSTDAEIASGLSRIIWPLLAAKWVVEPADDTDEEVEIAKFCEKWVMGVGRNDPFAAKWQDTLRHALLCLTYGFSAFEKTWGVDEDGKQVFANLFGVLPKSVDKFVFKTDGSGQLDYMLQRAWTPDGYKEAQIPAAKLMLFTFGREADNLWGKSILRNCYKNWFHKDKLLRVDGMRHERHGMGFTTITVDAGAGVAVKDAAEDLIREARANERGYAVLETGQEVEIIYPTSQGTDVIGSVQYHDTQTAQVLFSEVMHMVSGNLGAKGANESKVDFVLAVLQGLATGVEEVFNSQAIVELVGRNWGARKVWPKLNCEDLSKLSGTSMAETLAQLLPAGSGAITADVVLEQQLRESYQFPLLPDDIVEWRKEAERLNAKRKIEMASQPIVQPVAEPGETPVVKAPLKIAASERVRTAREPFPHEVYCAYVETSAWLDQEPLRVWHRVVVPYRTQQIERIAKAARTVSDEDFSAGRFFPDPNVRLMKKSMTTALAAALSQSYMHGRAAILQERKRQLSGQPVVARTMQEEDDFDLVPSKAQKEWTTRIAETFVTGLLGVFTLTAVDALKNARNADLSKADQERMVREALTSLSVPVQQADLGGAVVQSYTNGRNEQASSMWSDIETAFYSAVMDFGTCEECAELDGAEHEPNDPVYVTPNPNCRGDDRCRCVTIYVFREEAA